MIDRRVLFLAALGAGCSHASGGGGGWQDPVDPPLLGKATLSVFQSDNGHCRWLQIDPIAGTRRPLAWLDDDCGEPVVTWSPDGRRAVIWNADYPEDHLVEVSLTSGAWRKVLPPPGTIDSLFYRDGHLLAWTTVDVPASLMERLGLRKAGSDSTLAQAFRLEDGGWAPTEATPPDQALRAEYESSSMSATTDDLPDSAPSGLSEKLADDYGYDEWRLLGRSDAMIAFSGGSPIGIVIFKRANGKWDAAGGQGVDDYGDSLTSMKLRDHYLLLTGDLTQLFDLQAQRLVYSSTDSVQTVFWPLP
jgi:hypothetical protein